MARSELNDPLSKFRWTMSIDGFTRAGFVSATTPEYKMTSHSYKEGGAHLNPREIMDSIEYVPIVLTRGVTNDTSFNKWATGLFDLVQNSAGVLINPSENSAFPVPPSADRIYNSLSPGVRGFIQQTGLTGPSPVPSFAPTQNHRKDIKIKHVNRAGQTIAEYNLFGAWIIGYKPASDFNAMDDDGFSIETLTIAYDGFDVRYSGFAGAATSGGINSLF